MITGRSQFRPHISFHLYPSDSPKTSVIPCLRFPTQLPSSCQYSFWTGPSYCVAVPNLESLVSPKSTLTVYVTSFCDSSHEFHSLFLESYTFVLPSIFSCDLGLNTKFSLLVVKHKEVRGVECRKTSIIPSNHPWRRERGWESIGAVSSLRSIRFSPWNRLGVRCFLTWFSDLHDVYFCF